MVNVSQVLFGILLFSGVLIVIFLVIGLLIHLIKDLYMQRMSKNNIFKNADISNSRIDTIEDILNHFDGYKKFIQHQNFIFYITEYGIYTSIILDVYGIVIGKENDQYWSLKGIEKETEIVNPLNSFIKFNNEIKNKIGNYSIKSYIIMGGNCLFRVSLKTIKILRMNNFNYILNKKDMKAKYSKSEIDRIYNELVYLNENNDVIDK